MNVVVRRGPTERISLGDRMMPGVMTTTIEIGTPCTMAEWEVRPGNEAAFIDAWDRFAEWTAGHQPGAIVGVLVQDVADPRRFVSYGPWDSPEAIAAWRGSPASRAAFDRFRELCETITPHAMTCVAIRRSSA